MSSTRIFTYSLRPFILALLLASQWVPLKGQKPTETSGFPQQVQHLLEWRNLTKKEIKRRLLKGRQVEKYRGNILNGGIKRGSYLYDRDAGTDFYFSGQKVVLIIQENNTGQVDTTGGKLEYMLSVLGEESERLRSRHGRRFWEKVYPEYGISITMPRNANGLNQVSVFQPMDIEAYKKFLWSDPGPLIDESHP